jgi:hypothetical protein
MVRIFFSEPLPQLRHVVPLAQACGVGRPAESDPALARLFAEAPALWQASGIKQADIAAYSNHYDGRQEAKAFVRRARDAGLKTIIFDSSDNHFVSPPPDESAIVWRTAIYEDKIQPWERAMPAPCEDLTLSRGRGLELREKSAIAGIGFCGYVSPTWKNLARLLKGDFEKARGHMVRRRALNAFRGSTQVAANFVERPNYFGGALRANWEPSVSNQIREQFVASILDNDYTLCARGAGNFSIRFYETLAAGRIPVLIDTHCVLPFAENIDWKKRCLIVDQSDIRTLPHRLAEFHASLTPEAFGRMQVENRRLWTEWLEPLAFTRRAVDLVLASRTT